jgi:hypothetical protein
MKPRDKAMTDELWPLVEALVDDDLLNAYADAVAHFGTGDLVLFLDVGKGDLRAELRTHFEASLRASVDDTGGGFDKSMLAKVSRPASKAMKSVAGPLAFWFIVLFPDGRGACLAVGGQRFGKGASMAS